MKTYLIALYITFCMIPPLYTKINKIPPKQKITANKTNTKQNSFINEKGINFIKLNRHISLIQTKLSQIHKIPKLNSTKYNYYTSSNKINTNFKNNNIIIKNKRIYYKKIIEVKLIEKVNNKNILYPPPQIQFPTSKIWTNLNAIYLKFYKSLLYETNFYITVNPYYMNKIVEDLHTILGQNSKYSNISETYTWQINNYNISIAIPGYLFPKIIKIKFINTKQKELLLQDFKKEKKNIDSIISD